MPSRLHVFLSGRVQGVFLRAWAKTQADKLGLTGLARNLPDGRVEIIAEGKKENLAKFLGLLKKGPPAARVEEAAVKLETSQRNFREFNTE